MEELRILSVNISKQKGTIKEPVGEIEITMSGVKDDAHAGDWHRQVSILDAQSFKKSSSMAQREIAFGEFAENITTEGMDYSKITIGDRLISGSLILEVSQIGKKCHGTSCAIFKEVGDCVMPKEGIFCKVISAGTLDTDSVLSHRSVNL